MQMNVWELWCLLCCQCHVSPDPIPLIRPSTQFKFAKVAGNGAKNIFCVAMVEPLVKLSSLKLNIEPTLFSLLWIILQVQAFEFFFAEKYLINFKLYGFVPVRKLKHFQLISFQGFKVFLFCVWNNKSHKITYFHHFCWFNQILFYLCQVVFLRNILQFDLLEIQD